MAFKTNRPAPRSSTPAAVAPPAAAPAPAADPREEDLTQGKLAVRSMAYTEVFSFVVQGRPYDEWMPRIARSDDGLVPCLPCTDLETGEDCILILPGMFNSWLRRNAPAVGTKLRLRRKGKDPETGAWKLAVTRL